MAKQKRFCLEAHYLRRLDGAWFVALVDGVFDISNDVAESPKAAAGELERILDLLGSTDHPVERVQGGIRCVLLDVRQTRRVHARALFTVVADDTARDGTLED